MSSRDKVVCIPHVSQKVRARSSSTSYCNLESSKIPRALQSVSIVELLRNHVQSNSDRKSSKTPTKPRETILYFNGQRMNVSQMESNAIADVVALRAANNTRRTRSAGHRGGIAPGNQVSQIPVLLYPIVAAKMKRWLQRARRRIAVRKQQEQFQAAAAWNKDRCQRLVLKDWRGQLLLLTRFHQQKVKRAFRAWRAAVQIMRNSRADLISMLSDLIIFYKARRCFMVWRRYQGVLRALSKRFDPLEMLEHMDSGSSQLQSFSAIAYNAELHHRKLQHQASDDERNQAVCPYWMAWKAYISHRKKKTSQLIVLRAFVEGPARQKITQSTFLKWKRAHNVKQSVHFFVKKLAVKSLLRWKDKTLILQQDRIRSLKSQAFSTQCTQRKVMLTWRAALTAEVKLEVLGMTRCLENRRKQLPYAFALAGKSESYHLARCFERWKKFTNNRLRFLAFCENEETAFRSNVLFVVFRAWKVAVHPHLASQAESALQSHQNSISLVPCSKTTALAVPAPWASVAVAERLFRRRQQHFRVAETLSLVPHGARSSCRNVAFGLPPRFVLCRIVQALLLCSVLTKMSFRRVDADDDRAVQDMLEQGYADYHAVVQKSGKEFERMTTVREKKLDDVVRFRLWRAKKFESDAKRSTIAHFSQKLMQSIPESLRIPENAALTEQFTNQIAAYVSDAERESVNRTQAHLLRSKYLLERFSIAVQSLRMPEACRRPLPPSLGVNPPQTPVRPVWKGKERGLAEISRRMQLLLPKGQAQEHLSVSNAAPDKIVGA